MESYDQKVSPVKGWWRRDYADRKGTVIGIVRSGVGFRYTYSYLPRPQSVPLLPCFSLKPTTRERKLRVCKSVALQDYLSVQEGAVLKEQIRQRSPVFVFVLYLGFA